LYITQLELIKARLRANAAYSISDIIRNMIEDHEKSPEYAAMKAGEEYYKGNHDVLQKDFQKSYAYETKEGNYGTETVYSPELIINQNNSNHHNVHNYYADLIDQEVDYILGRPVVVSVEGAGTDPEVKSPEKLYENSLTMVTTDEEFQPFLRKVITEARKKGKTYIHPYYNRKGELRHVVFDALSIIPVHDTEYQDEIVEFLRYYPITVIQNGREYKRRRVEWWDSEKVTYYLEDNTGNFVLESVKEGTNPAPHWFESVILGTDAEPEITGRSWGVAPIIEVKANEDRTPFLNRIKGLQDAYNLLSSKLTNDSIDLVALFWIIRGYGGELSGMIRKKLELNKAVSIDDPEGDVDAKQVTLNTSERIEYLDVLKKDIYNLGQGIMFDIERSGNVNTTELHMRYAKLRSKANGVVVELKRGMKKLFWFITTDINENDSTSYDYRYVKVNFHYDEIINETELIDNILKMRGFVPDSILMNLVPFVDDPNQAYKEMQAQKKKEAQERADAFSMPRASGQTIDGKIAQAASAVEE